jgi:hypothetical protein
VARAGRWGPTGRPRRLGGRTWGTCVVTGSGSGAGTTAIRSVTFSAGGAATGMRSVTASTGGRPTPSGRRVTRGGTTGTQVVVPSNGRAPDRGPGATIRPRPFRLSTGAARSSRAGRGGTRGTRVVAPSVRADCGGRARARGIRVVGAAGGGAASPPAPRGRGRGMTATRRVNASVADSASVRTWRERPFVFAAAPAVRASFPMRSPSIMFRGSAALTRTNAAEKLDYAPTPL